jgi:hypothetical protein
VVVLGGALLSIMPTAPVQAACANPIVCENQLPGTPQSVWDVSDYSTTIQGFADPFSVNIGSSVNFKIESPASSYKEPFPSWLCFAWLQYVDGPGELTGAPGAAAEFGEDLPGLELAFALSPGARSFACALLACFWESGLFPAAKFRV